MCDLKPRGFLNKSRNNAAMGFPGVPGSKSSQLLYGSDFFILFHHFSKKDGIGFALNNVKMFFFSHFKRNKN